MFVAAKIERNATAVTNNSATIYILIGKEHERKLFTTLMLACVMKSYKQIVLNSISGDLQRPCFIIWESRDSKVDKSPRFPPMWPRFNSWTRHHVWVEFVVGNLVPALRVFLHVLRFSSLLKNQPF